MQSNPVTRTRTTKRDARLDDKIQEVHGQERSRTEGVLVSAPRGIEPGTAQNRIAIAMQWLELLEWALTARLDGNELETFCAPIWQATASLREAEVALSGNDDARPDATEVRQ